MSTSAPRFTNSANKEQFQEGIIRISWHLPEMEEDERKKSMRSEGTRLNSSHRCIHSFPTRRSSDLWLNMDSFLQCKRCKQFSNPFFVACLPAHLYEHICAAFYQFGKQGTVPRRDYQDFLALARDGGR